MPGYYVDTIFKTENSNHDKEQQSVYFQPTQAQLSRTCIINSDRSHKYTA